MDCINVWDVLCNILMGVKGLGGVEIKGLFCMGMFYESDE